MNYQVKFAQGQWNPEDWQQMRSPRWAETSQVEQHTDYIANTLPEATATAENPAIVHSFGETYLSMLLKRPVVGSCQIATTCAFENRMAPLLVFSQELGPVHRDHLEVVLYDHGLNLWHHYYKNGQPSWKLIAFADFELNSDEPYLLSAEMRFNPKGVFLTMGCHEHTVGCRLDTDWPQQYYVGFTGCEGRNRFYDFSLQSGTSSSATISERFSD